MTAFKRLLGGTTAKLLIVPLFAALLLAGVATNARADVTTQTMTAEQRKSVALEYLKLLDAGKFGPMFDLFADDATVYFPKWGIASGKDQITQMFTDLGSILASIKHDYAHFNYIFHGDYVVVEGTSFGTTSDGVTWKAGTTHAGFWADVFEIRDFKIQRVYIYLDPDYWSKQTDAYPWLKRDEPWPKTGSWTKPAAE